MSRYARRRFPPKPEQVAAQTEFIASAFGQRHAATRDANDGELVALAERLGASFVRAPPLDGWIYFRGVFTPTEIKVPEVEGLAKEYRPQQLRFFSWCRARNARWFTWRTEDDVLRDLGARRSA